MHHDRYGLPVTTSSEAAASAYREGVDLMLAGWPGAAQRLDHAIAHDPDYGLAHAARARMHAMYLERDHARLSIARARAAGQAATERERAHIEILSLASEGQTARALDLAPRHLAANPRDAMVLSTLLGAFGLYAFSGRKDHDEARATLCESLAPEYGEDWWFVTYHGWSLTEHGMRVRGRSLTERALDLRLDNAHAAHALAHAMFEDGEGETARSFIARWLPRYSPAGVLYSHITWHGVLHALEAGDAATAFHAMRDTLDPALSQAPPLNVLSDLASLLWRLKIYDHDVPAEAWSSASAYARELSPRLAAPFAAVHFAMIEAGSGDRVALIDRSEKLAAKEAAGSLAQGPVPPALCRALLAYADGDFPRAIAHIEPNLGEIVRIGGSHAQREVFEDTLIAAYMRSGEATKAAALLDARLHRRPSPRDARWRSFV